MHRFEKTRRLLNKKEYDCVFSQANKIITTELILLHSKNSLGYSRLGLALSKKLIAKATERNRIKRIIRESFRTHTLPAVDVIILARRGVDKVENYLINANLGIAWEKLTAFYVS